MKHLNETTIRTFGFNKSNRVNTLYLTVIVYFLLAAITLSSCSTDDDPIDPVNEEPPIEDPVAILPSVQLISGTEDVFEGVIGAPEFGSLQHTVKVTAPEGFTQLNIYKVVNGVQSGYISFDTTSPDYVQGSNSYTHNLSYIFTEIDLDIELYFIAEVVDANNNTATLDFAEATVRRPMQLVQTIFMETRIPLQPDNMSIAQFLEINGDAIGGVNLGKVIDQNINDKVAAILSYGEGEGIYLSSPNAVVHHQSVDDIQNKSKTKFKKLNSEVVDLGNYNIYDTFTIENLYNSAAFNNHQEKAEQLNENDVYVIKTDDNRTALFKITYFEVINGDQVYLTMDMYITQ